MKPTSSVSLFGAVALAVLGILAGQFAILSYFESRRQTTLESASPGSELPFEWDRDLATSENDLRGSFRMNLGSPVDEPPTLAINPDNLDLPEEEPTPSRSLSTPAELPQPENAAPISEKLKAEEPIIRSIIKQELPNSTAEEQEIWLERLQGMAFEEMRFLLRMRKQDLLQLRTNLEGFLSAPIPEINKSPERPKLPVSALAVPVDPLSPGLQQSVLQGKLLELVQASLKNIQEAQHVILNNIANANTTGFKRSQVLFEDLAYRTERLPGLQNNNGKFNAVGITVGMGSRISATRVDHRQGLLVKTGGKLDLAITGEGFFQIQAGKETFYTRAGTFSLNPDGDIVLSSSDKGRLLDPAITIPQGVTEISISGDGTVSVQKPPATTLTQLGQIQTVKFLNPQGLTQRGENLFSQTDASGNPEEGTPGSDGHGTLKQGYLEASNVDLTYELIEWKKLQNQLRVLSYIAGLPVIDSTSAEVFTDPKSPLPLSTKSLLKKERQSSR